MEMLQEVQALREETVTNTDGSTNIKHSVHSSLMILVSETLVKYML